MSTQLPFVKYQACGNDYIIVDERTGQVVPEGRRNDVAMAMMNRNFGIGADGVAYIVASDRCDAMMRLIDSPGGEAYMCGNGIRCVAHYLWSVTGKDRLRVDTRSGVKEIEVSGGRPAQFRVNMGRLHWHAEDLEGILPEGFAPEESILDRQFDLPGLGTTQMSVVHIGEPHAILFVDDLDKTDIERYGEAITTSQDVFPRLLNVNLVKPIADDAIQLRTFEAGVQYETLACGTGCVSSAAVARLTGRIASRSVRVIARGGQLQVDLTNEGLYMSGPAQPVFTGSTNVTLHDDKVSLSTPCL